MVARIQFGSQYKSINDIAANVNIYPLLFNSAAVLE